MWTHIIVKENLVVGISSHTIGVDRIDWHKSAGIGRIGNHTHNGYCTISAGYTVGAHAEFEHEVIDRVERGVGTRQNGKLVGVGRCIVRIETHAVASALRIGGTVIHNGIARIAGTGAMVQVTPAGRQIVVRNRCRGVSGHSVKVLHKG